MKLLPTIRAAAASLLPFAMFGVAVSFFTVVALGRADGLVAAYATIMFVLTAANLVRERVRAARAR